MKLPAGFGDVDFTDWIRGLLSSFIVGGSNAVVSGVVVSVKDPTHYAVGTWDFFEVVGSVFLMSGLLNMFSFLRTKPIPDLRTVERTVRTTEIAGRPDIVVTTAKETTIEKTAPPEAK